MNIQLYKPEKYKVEKGVRVGKIKKTDALFQALLNEEIFSEVKKEMYLQNILNKALPPELLGRVFLYKTEFIKKHLFWIIKVPSANEAVKLRFLATEIEKNIQNYCNYAVKLKITVNPFLPKTLSRAIQNIAKYQKLAQKDALQVLNKYLSSIIDEPLQELYIKPIKKTVFSVKSINFNQAQKLLDAYDFLDDTEKENTRKLNIPSWDKRRKFKLEEAEEYINNLLSSDGKDSIELSNNNEEKNSKRCKNDEIISARQINQNMANQVINKYLEFNINDEENNSNQLQKNTRTVAKKFKKDEADSYLENYIKKLEEGNK